MEHSDKIKYGLTFSTKEVKETGHIVLTYITIGQDVMDTTETIRIDLADHPLYKQLQAYVKNNPR